MLVHWNANGEQYLTAEQRSPVEALSIPGQLPVWLSSSRYIWASYRGPWWDVWFHIGANDERLVGWCMVEAKDLIVFLGYSQAGGMGDSTGQTGFPGLATPLPSVQVVNKGSRNFNPPEIVTEGPQSLQSRTASVGSPYLVGTFGPMLPAMKLLDSAFPGRFTAGTIFIDGSGLATHWMPNSAYPAGGPPWFSQVVTMIHAMESDLASRLAALSIWLGGVDAGRIPDGTDYPANIVIFCGALRTEFPTLFAILMDRLTSQVNFTFAPEVRQGQTNYCASDAKSALLNTDPIGLRDGLHFTDKGYCDAGELVFNALMQLIGGRPI